MSAAPADVALLDQLHADAARQLDELIANVGPALEGCECGHALDSAEHASELASALVQNNAKGNLGSILAVAILRAIVRGGAS
jgi:hypothetical protein